jgi:hypothetical protein
MRGALPPLLHKLVRLARITGIHKSHQHGAKLLEVHRFRHVRIEASFDALLVHVAQDVGR